MPDIPAQDPVATTAPDEPEPAKNERDLTQVTGGLLAGLASQVAILTAILVYFGWVRARATYGYFGVDVSALNFSVQDYLLRGIDAAFPLLIVIGLIVVCVMIWHEQLQARLTANTAMINRAAGAGAVLVLVGLLLGVELKGSGGSYFPGPAMTMIGFALTAYALAARNKSFYLIALGGMALVAFVWTVASYASFVGTQRAEQVAATLTTSPEVTVYSISNLDLTGPGVTMTPVEDSEYHVAYGGLRLLVDSGGNYFLLPEGWRQGRGSVVVLSTTAPDIRIEFTAAPPG
jgi:hypothetical protein